MVTLNKKCFKLPRIEREKFVSLMRIGLDYNRDKSVYSINSYNNIEKIIDALSDILKSPVLFLQSCTVCGKDFPCSECKYVDLCSTKNLPFSCVCTQCLTEEKAVKN